MFKFDCANSSMTINNFQKDGTKKDKVLVCPANSNNILSIFIPFICFSEEVEHILNLPHGYEIIQLLFIFLNCYKFLERIVRCTIFCIRMPAITF